MPSEFPQTTPAKPKAPLPGNIQNGWRPGAARPAPEAGSRCRKALQPAAHIATFAAHCAGNTRDRIRRIPVVNIDHEPATIGTPPSHPRGRVRRVSRRYPAQDAAAGGKATAWPQCGKGGKPANSPCSSPARPRQRPYFSSDLRPILGGAGSPAMEINDRRNKPFGPGGSTRRLHPSPPFNIGGFRRGRNRIDEGVKGEFFLGMVPPLSGYAIVANDNYAPVAQAA